jgi:LPS-assembly protein
MLSAIFLVSTPLLAHADGKDQAAQGQQPARDAGSILYISADTLKYDNQKKELLAEGHAEITTNKTVIRADRVTIYDTKKILEAEGHVQIFDGKDLVYADRARLRTDNMKGTLDNVTVIVKQGPLDPETAKSLGAPSCAMKASGKNKLVASGKQVDREGQKRYVLFDAMFTPCDCGDDPPSWKLTMTKGWFELDRQAVMLYPILYVNDVPVMAFPGAMLPIGDRRSGVLFPRFSFGRNGFEMDNYLYLTMGRSADMTLEADYIQDRGAKLGLETRYAISRQSFGKLYGTFIKDIQEPNGEAYRWSATHQHWSMFGDRFYLNDHINLVSDNQYPNDFAFDVWERETEYMKSDLNLAKAFDDVFLGTSAVYYQDLKKGQFDLWSGQGLSTVQVLPSATASLSLKQIPKIPLAFAMDVSYVHYYDPITAVAQDDNPDIDPGDQIRRVHRLTVYPTVKVPFNIASVLKWDNSFSFRYNFYATDGISTFPRNTGYGVVRSSLRTEIGRNYDLAPGGAFAALRHAIVPSIEYRQIPFSFAYGGVPVMVDEIDNVEPFSQVMFCLRNRLDFKRSSGTYGRFLDIALYQGLELGANPGGSRVSPLGLDLDVTADWVRSDTYIGYEWSSGKLSEVYSNNTFTDPRGDTFSLQYNYLPTGARTHFSTGLEELFASTYDPRLRSTGEINNANFTVNLKVIEGLFALYSANYSFIQNMFMFQTFGFSYRSPCDCWSIQAKMNIVPGQSIPDFTVMFDMTNLGNFKG